MFQALKGNSIVVNIMIILVAISPAFALGEGNKNLLLISGMCLSPYFLIRYPVVLPKIDFPLIIICIMMMAFPLIFHPETVRWSTLLYSCLFCMYFMAFCRVLTFAEYSSKDLLNVITWLLYAYCIVLIIQQFCVITGLPIFNISNYNPRTPFKLNSLMAEPSHSARILTLLFFLYLVVYEQNSGISKIKDLILSMDRKVLFAFLYPTITMGSGTAFLFLGILIMGYIPQKNIIALTAAGIILIPILYFAISNISSAKRVADFFTTTLSFNEQELIRKDLSAAIRIIPTIHGAKAVTLTTKEGIFGNGVDADNGLTPLPSVDCGAGSFSIWYNFGFIVTILFWGYSMSICLLKNKTVMSLFFWFLLCFFYGGLNNQLVWFTMIMFTAYKTAIRNSVIYVK